MFILDPDGSARAVNITQAFTLFVMPEGASGKRGPSIVAAFMDPTDPEGHVCDLAFFERESTAHAVLADFVSKFNPGMNAQKLLDECKEEIEDRYRRIQRFSVESDDLIRDLRDPNI